MWCHKQETTRPPALTRVLGLEPQEGTGPSPCDPYTERRNTQGRKASSLCHLYFTCCRSPPTEPSHDSSATLSPSPCFPLIRPLGLL